MIILDTNVVSEAARVGRNLTVVSWLDAQTAETLYFTAISLSELMVGIQILPTDQRRDTLSADLNTLIANFFGARVLPFDRQAAIAYGALVATARLAGKAISVADGQIGAIASIHGFTVATRDTAPFIALGIPVINPWETR